jgi:hypothetical protein
VAGLLATAIPSAVLAEVGGGNSYWVPAQTEVLVSLPHSPDSEEATDFAVTVLNAAAGEIELAPTPTGQYDDGLHYLRFVSGTGEGFWCTILGQNGAVFSIDPDVAGRLGGDETCRIHRHRTVGSTFPPELEGLSYTDGEGDPNKRTHVLIYYNNEGAPATNETAVYDIQWDGTAWSNGLPGIGPNTVIEPETMFKVVNNDDAPILLMTHGDVVDHDTAAILRVGDQLNMGSGFPQNVALNDLDGLKIEGLRVFFYDNAAPGVNKSAVKVAAYFNGNWIGNGVTGEETLNSAEAVAIRLPFGNDTAITLTNPGQ